MFIVTPCGQNLIILGQNDLFPKIPQMFYSHKQVLRQDSILTTYICLPVPSELGRLTPLNKALLHKLR